MQDLDNHKIVALIPAYNEAGRIATVVRGVIAHLPVLVVDDGSVDDTAALAQAAGTTVLRQATNQGKGAALQAGFRQALAHGYDAILTIDADGQHDPAEIPNFLHAYRPNHTDLIIGVRDFRQMPWPRRISNSIGRWMFSWVLGQTVHDNQSGYRLISRRLAETTLMSTHHKGYEFEVDMITTCVQGQFVLDWVPIRTIYAGEISKIDPLRHTLRFLHLMWQTRQRCNNSKGNMPVDYGPNIT